MSTSLRIALGILLLAGTEMGYAQASRVDLGATFLSQHSLKADTSEGFWMEGGSAELGFMFAKGIGIAAAYSRTHTGSIGSSGVPLTLSVTNFGPRYRWHGDRRTSIYGEGLFGVASGSGSVFPSNSGSVPNTSSFAVQVNGGLDCRLSKRFAIRALDVGYLRTTLPNATDNVQNILRLGAGIVIRLGQ